MELKSIGANTTEIRLDNLNAVLFSYKTPVAAQVNGEYFKTSRKWSMTTSKHINKWVPELCEERPQEFFDNILVVYMNPAAQDGKGGR
ncbi:MAG: hypothetical protein KAJ07_00365 [Planctomycetes bacterium]|nr:hypothetical protein [Planctomycetota bacterium]